ncbi:MAG TPA: PAS domain S-box protein, partial [Nitrospira sp.]|nr:PAS domain S-box protein [Nitrospira sp.]
MMNPQPVESLIQELRMHRLALELKCQELQRMQAETEESRNHYRELYESIPIGYATVDVTGRIYDMNPAGVSLLGIDQARQSNNFYSFFANDDGDAALLFFHKRLNQQDAGCCDLKMRKRDGGRFLAAVHAVPFKGGTGNREGLRIAFQDITGRKEIEETLRQHKLELEANRIELQELMAKLFAAQEEERRRIACDLHDDHCQRITALILEASAMERLVKSVMPSLTPRVGSLKSKLGDILDDFRHLTHELHPRHLDTVSLACSMRTYIQEFMEYT